MTDNFTFLFEDLAKENTKSFLASGSNLESDPCPYKDFKKEIHGIWGDHEITSTCNWCSGVRFACSF